MASLFRDRLNESDEAGSLLDFIQVSLPAIHIYCDTRLLT